MTQNPPSLRPDIAPKARIAEPRRVGQPMIGMVSLGCPKALVDSERILTRLRAEGYAISPYGGRCGHREHLRVFGLRQGRKP
jgi:ribosomal protein S12 methylthiotransferase